MEGEGRVWVANAIIVVGEQKVLLLVIIAFPLVKEWGEEGGIDTSLASFFSLSSCECSPRVAKIERKKGPRQWEEFEAPSSSPTTLEVT